MQKAARFDQDLKDRGATRAQRFELILQKSKYQLLSGHPRLLALLDRLFNPVLRGFFGSGNPFYTQGSLWSRTNEFLPVKGRLEEQPSLVFPTFEAPQCSILIPVFNQWRSTYRCLQALLKNTHGVTFEVLLLDDASSDETTRFKDCVSGVRIVRQPKNLGFLRNCNRGALQAKGQALLFLNNDTCVEPGWLEAMWEALNQSKQVGIVGAKLVFSNGRLQEAGGIVWQDGSGWNYGRNADPVESAYSYRKEVDYCSGACLLVRHDVWTLLNGFDDQFAPAYYEDTDLAFRARAQGFTCVYEPAAVVVHHEGISHGSDVGHGIKRHQRLNQSRFEARWRDTLSQGHQIGPTHLFHARDRSSVKRHILVVDTTVPAWDTNAGARLTYLYTRLLAEEGYAVHFAPVDCFASQPYTRELQALGIEVLYGQHGPCHEAWLRQFGRHLHAVYLHRPDVADAYLPNVKRYAPQAKLLLQCHDLHFLRTQRQYLLEGGVGEGAESLRWKAIEMRVFQQVDVIHTPSEDERNWIHSKFPSKKVQSLPVFFYDHVPLDCQPDDGLDLLTERQGLLFVGGARHPPNRDGLHWFIREVLPELRASHADLVLTIVGSHWDDLVGRQGVTVLGKVTDAKLSELYQSHRVALLPIRFGAGVNGKLIEAYAWGLPTAVVNTNQSADEQVKLLQRDIRKLLDDGSCWSARRIQGLTTVRAEMTRSRAQAALDEALN